MPQKMISIIKKRCGKTNMFDIRTVSGELSV